MISAMNKPNNKREPSMRCSPIRVHPQTFQINPLLAAAMVIYSVYLYKFKVFQAIPVIKQIVTLGECLDDNFVSFEEMLRVFTKLRILQACV